MVSTRNPCNCMDYYSFTDPEGMEGWVGLVGWPIADTVPRKCSHVSHRSGKVRQTKTDVLTTKPRRQQPAWNTASLRSSNRLKLNIDKTEWLLASSRPALSLLGDIHPEQSFGPCPQSELHQSGLLQTFLFAWYWRTQRIRGGSVCWCAV